MLDLFSEKIYHFIYIKLQIFYLLGYENNMNDEEKKEREHLRYLVLHAKTLDEVKEARKRLSLWLKRHPDDKQLLGEGESLVMLEKALINLKNEHA